MTAAGESEPPGAEAALHVWLSGTGAGTPAWPSVPGGLHQVIQGSQLPLPTGDGPDLPARGRRSDAASVNNVSYSLLSPEENQSERVKNMTESIMHQVLGSVYSDLHSVNVSDMKQGRADDGRVGPSIHSVSVSEYNFTSSKDLSGLLSAGEMENGTNSFSEEDRANTFISVLMGSASPATDNGEANASKNSSAIIKEALSFTLEASEETLASAEDGGGLQRMIGGTEWPYLSALTHNLSYHHHPSVTTNLANVTNGRETLFADYPPHLLDFAVFCCVLFIVLGVPGNLITIIALVKCKKVHNATAVFIINLTLSDLMFGVFNLPLAASLFGHRAWVHTGFLCLLFPILRYGLVAVSVFTVLAITINRYIMIAHPRLYHRMVPESLRWLLTRGKTRRARQVAAQLARHNQLTLPPTAHAQMDHLAAHVYLDVPWGTLVTLFKTPRLRKHTLVLAFMWLAVSLADGGFRHNLAGAGQMSDLLGGPGHLGYLLGAGVEAGAVVLAVVLSTQLYRRAFLVLTLLLSAALSLAVICVLQLVKESWLDVTALATALRFMGVLIVGGARVGVGVVSVEVAPTTARASAVGLCAAHAAVGEILTPLLAIVAELTYPSVPWLMSAAGCLVAAMLALLLPETSGTSLPDVVDEAEVIGLCYRGDVLKTCDFGYGRSPYWVEVDGLIVSRSVSEAALEDDDKCRRLKPNVDSQLKTKVSERRDKKRNMIDEGAGPSKLMVPHVKSRRREISALFPGSSGSVASSCSHCSLVSLVDVSRINGNNSDTTDSNDFECRDKINKLSSVCGEETSKTEQNVVRSTAEGNEEINAKVPPEVKDHAAGKSSVRSKEGKTNTAANSDPSAKDNAPVYEAIPKANVSSTESVESDLSISVCSLQFKHIRRLVSPTDRRRKPGLQYSSSSVYAAGEGRTLVQEYMSRNSFKGDVSSLRYPTLASESKCAKNNEHESPITTPSSVLKECIRIARNRERITVLNRLQEEETDENASFQQDTNTVSSQASVFSTDTSESTDESVLRDSQSDGPSPSPSIFIPSSTLEYVAGGRTETTSRTLRYDTLKTTSDIYHSKYHSFRSGLCYSHSVSEATASKNLQVNIQSEVQSERDMCSQEKVSKTSQKPSINEVDKADGKEVTGNASPVIPTSTEASVSATATSAMETPPGASDSALREREKLGLNIDSQDTRKQEDHTDPERTNSRDTTLFGKDIIIIDVDETKL
ncbi:uncharacterized protein [Cherax quadricarinatus]|uniref:uncharacterized protein isoform X1 n=1 Tax=Cherax quadricarinatus TaxID=27406 RepID=UPI00387EC256